MGMRAQHESWGMLEKDMMSCVIEESSFWSSACTTIARVDAAIVIRMFAVHDERAFLCMMSERSFMRM